MQTFETTRLLMRQLQPEDESFYCTCYTDPVLMQHIGEPLSPEAASRSFAVALKIATEIPMRRCTWVMQEKSLLLDIGLLALVCDQKEPEPINAELGVLVANSFQSKGYVSEVIAFLADITFSQTRLDAIHVHHRAKNIPVSKVALKLGFVCETDHSNVSGIFFWVLNRARWQQVKTENITADYN